MIDMSDTDNIQNLVTPEIKTGGDEKKMSSYTGQDKPHVSYYGDAMNDNNVNNMVDDTIPHVVILIGFPEYGKSTFVSSFYHVVMKNGKIGDYQFVDSETILGFEQRAHIRKEEIKVRKRLDRTPVYLNYFLSMVFINQKTGKKVKLVLSDRAGDTYKDYGKFGQKINDDKALNRAKHILFFLEAYALISDGFLDMQQNLGLLISRMVNYGVFGENKRIDVVFNKSDLIDVESETFKTNRDEIIKIINRATKIHREDNLYCTNVPMNDEINKYFEYLLESCEEPVKNSEELIQKVDWVSSKLKEIEKR